MKIAYFDCFSGAAGDMILAGLIDAGCSIEFLKNLVRSLDLPGVELIAQRVRRHGVAATHVTVKIARGAQSQHRHLHNIEKIVEQADLTPAVKQEATRVFHRLADAEAHVHGCPVENVHFHEVGADDAIVDIVGAVAALHHLGIQRVICSPIPAGSGTVHCEHGVMPVPAPATAHLLRGVPLAACEEQGELCTPTGAAILSTLAGQFGPMPPMRLAAVGVGAGTREGQTRPNILRVLIGDAADSLDAADGDMLTVLETQLDDAPGQVLAFAMERLFEAGALDVFVVPILMKKGRPGHLLTVLASADNAPSLERILFAHTPTLGVRRRECMRTRLTRAIETVRTAYGPIRLKVATGLDGRPLAVPEYDDCAAAAREHGLPLTEIRIAALDVWKQRHAEQRS